MRLPPLPYPPRMQAGFYYLAGKCCSGEEIRNTILAESDDVVIRSGTGMASHHMRVLVNFLKPRIDSSYSLLSQR